MKWTPNLIVWKPRKSRRKKIKSVALLSSLFLFFVSITLSADDLADHPSPYIRLHADDAVKWRVWDADILQQAKSQNKLIFFSIGYYACHWCHVMREQSFNNEQVAEILNTRYIPVKVDRELNPALDDYLMNFVQMTRGYGGWPLNVFVTPDGYPMVGLVYLPQPDFLQLLQALDNDWRNKQQHMRMLAEEAFEFSKNSLIHSMPVPTRQKLSELLLGATRGNADELSGGMGDQAKFPQPALVLSLLAFYQHQNDTWLREFLLVTLDHMASGGLHDVIGGGFFRYTVDPLWQTPHYEKMLYTNVGLAKVYMKAYRVFGDQTYLALARETIDFMLREMWSEQGFVSSLSAQDNNGIEGGAYLWQRDELRRRLGADKWKAVQESWQFIDVTEGDGVLPAGLALGKEWDDIRRRLMSKRMDRGIPVDDKVLMSWNGYALSMLADMVKLSNDKSLRQHGERLFKLLGQSVEQGLQRTAAGVERQFLEDHAFVIQGMLDWAEISSRDYEKAAKALTIRAMQLFSDARGWRLSNESILPTPADQRNIPDAQLPSPQVVMLKLVERLGLSDNASMEQTVRAFKQEVDARLLQNPLGFASHLVFFIQSGDPSISEK